MKKILHFCKLAWRDILINIIGMFMIALGMSFVYHHTISNVFLLFIISLALVYFGVPLFRRDPLVSKKEIALFHAVYVLEYLNFKHGTKSDNWSFNEDHEELKAIRDFVDNNVEEIKKPK